MDARRHGTDKGLAGGKSKRPADGKDVEVGARQGREFSHEWEIPGPWGTRQSRWREKPRARIGWCRPMGPTRLGVPTWERPDAPKAVPRARSSLPHSTFWGNAHPEGGGSRVGAGGKEFFPRFRQAARPSFAESRFVLNFLCPDPPEKPPGAPERPRRVAPGLGRTAVRADCVSQKCIRRARWRAGSPAAPARPSVGGPGPPRRARQSRQAGRGGGRGWGRWARA
jgi:hypothetical protein